MDTVAILKAFNESSKNTLMETLDIEYVALGDDFLTAKMPVNSRVHQPYGQLHGGATAALAESVGSAASNFFIDSKTQFVNGIQLSINHIKSKREGMVFATAKNIHKGKTTHLWEVRIVDENDDLISVAKMTNIVLTKRS
ncbi:MULTISPECIES: PaaI family thioesterase [Polaribacter]|uniref:Hotdog fold thioesterase n=1 Tax=Polaribacter sejongensis TaxID=985043 RepID=A0AAJ1QZ11_9FLAO|nr:MULTISPECIES: hotdog fold thioesterase [Polaribacter]MDN3620710.1 hotdog fold thioesterase [Polaribacter undariae]UWD32100.1 hotdog fold thioesterase [Polaribacter undariae]